MGAALEYEQAAMTTSEILQSSSSEFHSDTKLEIAVTFFGTFLL